MLNSKALAASASAAKVYVEDVFSTWLYTGTGSAQTITNGIDLSGKGGLTWIKIRDTLGSHFLFDTSRGATKDLRTNSTNAEGTLSGGLTAFNSTGFSLGSDNAVNGNTSTYASWTFRKAVKFFDVVTYTGNGSNRTISHNLGSTPGCIIVKQTSAAGQNWIIYHRGLSSAEQKYLLFNTSAAGTLSTVWNNTAPTSTVFTVGTDIGVNESGQTYVAYLFAHDAGGFGDSGNDSVVKCGAMTGYARTVDLGWEPQWVLVKSTASSAWFIIDSMRGWTNGGNDPVLQPNSSDAEYTGGNYGYLTPTGFVLEGYYNSDPDVIYIAIRRGPMKTPTDATKVFAVSKPGTGVYTTTTNFPADSAIVKRTSNATDWNMMSRLTGNNTYLNPNQTSAETTVSNAFGIASNTTFTQNIIATDPLNYIFRRAPGFFDVVAYTGTGSARTVSHNLGVAPELMIVKRRNAVVSWIVYAAGIGATNYLALNTTAAADYFSSAWNDTTPTSSVFTVGDASGSNASAGTYIAYLFASCPGVSKVGSYTGTGTTLSIDCGFTNGARFVLIKRTDSAGDWYVWDTARGIIAANDPYLLLNSTAAEVTNTDYIDPLSSGFQISSTAPAAINANGGSYIFLAIA